MTCLLDTHIVIWLLFQPEKVPVAFSPIWESPDAEFFVSEGSLWELFNKLARGRLDVVNATQEGILRELEAARIRIVPIMLEDIRMAAELPHHHRDPFDRLLIAQARRRNLTLVSADQWFHTYDVQLLPL